MSRPDIVRASSGGHDAPVVAARAVTKRYGGITALDGVTVELLAGRVHAIVGENGAGKSTLTGILGGVISPDSGTVEIGGRPVELAHPAAALDAGIAVVYQELSLFGAMSVADNVTLGIQPLRAGFIDRKKQRAMAEDLLARVGGAGIDPDEAVENLTVARQQLVEVAKVLARRPAAIIFDEPTAVLPSEEADTLLELVRSLADEGVAVGYISHRLAELTRIADDVTVLRDGKLVWTKPLADVTVPEIVSAMVGRAVEDAFPERTGEATDEPVLEVRNLLLPGTEPDGISFTCRKGEILGVAGLVGSGRSRLARYLFGMEGSYRGEVLLDGRPYHPRSPRHAARSGVMLVPEDRKRSGVILDLGADRNVGLPSLGALSKLGFVDRSRERELASGVVSDLAVRISDVTAPVSSLSGGNQQKIALGKWLVKQPKLLILDEPLRGIDVNAKSEIHRMLRRLADDGLAIILISSELPEVLGLSDRVLVMRDGKLAATFDQKPFSPDEIMAVATMEVTR
ncbi:MAG: sugar ABC transporter ATP-binding protein [Actinomycetes bacterium]